MTPFDSLFIGFVTVLAFSGWVLWVAARRAKEGYEDTLGFHLGIAPLLSLRMEASLAVVDNLPVTFLAPRRRRSGNSRPPMRVASAVPFEQAVSKKRRPKRVDSTPPIAVSAQAVFNKILGQESAQ